MGLSDLLKKVRTSLLPQPVTENPSFSALQNLRQQVQAREQQMQYVSLVTYNNVNMSYAIELPDGATKPFPDKVEKKVEILKRLLKAQL